MSSSVRVQVVRLPGTEDLPLPAYATGGSAGADLLAAVTEPLELLPGERALVPTGLRLAVPPGYEAQVRPRSGLALRHGIVLPNAPGTIDSDYRGEVRVFLWNTGDEAVPIRRGDRIAQLVLSPVTRIEWRLESKLEDTERGDGGFGSTGAS